MLHVLKSNELRTFSVVQIVDVTPTTYTVQLAGTTEKIDGFIDAIAENTILEVVRSGVLVSHVAKKF